MSSCNFCGRTDPRFLFRGQGFDDAAEAFDLVECPGCGLAWVDPTLAPEALAPYYRSDYYGGPDAKFNPILERAVLWASAQRARKTAKHVKASGMVKPAVLDVGCGRATFLRAMHAIGYEAVGTELPGFSFPVEAPGLRLLHCSAETLPFGEAEFDVVSIWHVLEHTGDPASVLRTLARVLKPGGVLCLAVPHFGSAQARLFGRHWFHLDLPRHLFHFRRATLVTMLESVGFEVFEVRTQSWEQNVYGFLQSGLNTLFRRGKPNFLYQALKRDGLRGAGLGRVLLHSCMAGAALPLAVVENLVTPRNGTGATLIIFARKT